ncbi:MAG TPA: hydrogenase 4 subunit B [Stellaceae bacterium]|nr:hydrogenase 4 subunit B [Stellaceae bacterium]
MLHPVMLGSVCVALALYAIGAIIGVAAGRRGLFLVYGLSAVAAALCAFAAFRYLAADSPAETAVLPLGLPWIGAHFRCDPLSAFFVGVVGLAGAMISLYALEYARHDAEPGRALPFYPVFLAGMTLVLIADDAYAFLLSWEFMSLSSWLLVLTNHRDGETRKAALLYLVMASFGTGALLFAFGLLSADVGGYDFATLRAAALAPWRGALVFVLALIGAGSKAGLAPLHVWLPPAHAAAPSHVSALMSGVMTKVALYGLIRILFDLAGPPAWWWGGAMVILGGASALLGILHAVMQQDLKRLLAYSTMENIGIIVVGLGLALAFRANHLEALAVLSLIAALLHVFNHAAFKSLLFLGAGAVLVATGERDMERLGGLIHRMPRTALLFLVGAAAISALPPFNGFVSEWLIFQAILNAFLLPQWVLKFAVPVVGAMLALAAALAAVAFVKAFGVAFLGRPRSPAAERAAEVGPAMFVPMALLALLCAGIGVAPQLVIAALGPVAAATLPGSSPLPTAIYPWIAPLGPDRSSYSGLVILAAVALMAALLAFAIHRLGSHRLRRSPAWDCGFPDPRPATQYTASSFAQPIRRIFGSVVFAARERIDMPEPGDLRPARFAVTMRDPVWDGIYAPIISAVSWLAAHVNVVQFQTVRRYLSLMFATLVLLLLIVAISQ